jgi:hypothetical protein
MDVVYILGYGRSGSTILDIVLGSDPTIQSVGELDLLSREWEDRSCSCGLSYDACAFWSRVRFHTEKAIGPQAVETREQALRCVETLRAYPLLLMHRIPSCRAQAYRELLRAELAAIAHVSGKPTILDSSKSAREAAGRALAIRRIAGVPVKMIHLVRDGRAVLWSVKRGDNVRLGDGCSEDAAAFSCPALRAVGGWVLANAIALLTALVSERGTVLRVRYEDFVRDPRRELIRIGEFLGRDLTAIADRIERGETFAAGHNTGGNRAGKAGPLRLREDREWETRLGRTDRALYWALGWPLALALASRPRQRPKSRVPA